MVVQVIQGGAGDLRTQYPGLILLVAAFFFPVGLIMLVLTGQDLCTANFSMSSDNGLSPGSIELTHTSVGRYDLFEEKDQALGITGQLDHRLLW